MPKGVEPLSVEGWLIRGAIREDDAEGEANPQDDPYNPNLKRPLHHFYDPVFNRPLSATGLSMIDSDVHRAVDWAIGSWNSFSSPLAQEYVRRNHFTVFDAREAMYRALTGRDGMGNVVAATEIERKKYWATTFRALGDVVHLVQDMGQPQHTRNDPHAGKFPTPLTGHTSVYEKYIEARAIGADVHIIDDTAVKNLQPLNYDGYPIPTFSKYSDFWSTRNGTYGRGLADYSNRGFFSAGTNLGNNDYDFPSNNAANYRKESTAGLIPSRSSQTISFLKGSVYDAYLNTKDDNVKITSESLFDTFLFTNKTYSLNRFNYNDTASLLIPRAVAYSAGLINHFFRGRIEFKADPNNPGKYLIRNLGAEDMKGTFTLYYDAKDGKRYPVAGDLAGETWVYRSVAAEGELTNLGFTPPVEPAPKKPGVYMLVFNGDMGEEEAVPGSTVGAVAATKVQPPSRIAFLLSIGSYTGQENNDVFVVDPDGGNVRNVTNKPGSYDDIAWSPDGTRIAFSSNRDGTHEIYVVNVDNGELLNISNTAGSDSNPTWSPDGTKIAFQNNSSGNSEIMVASADGASIKNLTNTPEDREWAPVWSPTGSGIVIDSYFAELYELAVIDAGSGARRRLTISPEGDKYDYFPRWSPDGEKIVFESRRDGNFEIYVMAAKGDSVTRLTNNSASDWFPRWSPDGSQIAFVNSSDGNDKIHVIKPDGSGEILLTNNPDTVSDWHPTWSPDGDKIAFVTTRSGRGGEIYIMNADGSNQTFLTKGSRPIWSPR